MKGLLRSLVAVMAILVASITYTFAADVYVTTLQGEDGPIKVIIMCLIMLMWLKKQESLLD